jgi:hypothetical protein
MTRHKARQRTIMVFKLLNEYTIPVAGPVEEINVCLHLRFSRVDTD